MVKLTPPLAGVGAVALALSVGCLLPTDRGDELQVRITGGMSSLILGDTARVTAQVVDAGAGVLANVVIVFRSSDTTVLTVDSLDGLLRALSEGEARITALTPQFADAQTDTLFVRVVRGVGQGIHSFEVGAARFGEILTIVGTGLDPDSLAVLEIGEVPAQVKNYVRSPDPGGFDSLLVWVPPPAPPMSQVDIVRKNGSRLPLPPLTVLQQDLYEPNDVILTIRLSLQTALPVPFFNPALAFEPGTIFDEELGSPVWFQPTSFDLYFVLLEAPGDLSVIFSSGTEPSPEALDGMEIVTGPSSVSPLWLSFRCNGLRFEPDPLQPPASRLRLSADSQVVALKDALFFFAGTGRYDLDSTLTAYSLRIRDEYVSDLAPDAWEENDLCDLASTLPTADSTVLDSLTFDNPGDFDWYRVLVQGDTTVVTVRVSSADAAFTPPEIFLFEEAFAPEIEFTWSQMDVLPLVGRNEAGTDSLSVTLPPGSYLLLATNIFTSSSPYTLSVTRSAVP